MKFDKESLFPSSMQLDSELVSDRLAESSKDRLHKIVEMAKQPDGTIDTDRFWHLFYHGGLHI